MRLPRLKVLLSPLLLLSCPHLAAAQPLRSPLLLRQQMMTEFTIIAGNAVFDESPGGVCDFDFGDPASPYNRLTGFNAAHIYQKPGDYTLTLRQPGKPDITKPVHVVPDRRPVMKVQPTDNLADVIKALPSNCIVLLPAGATYTLVKPAEINARNVCFRASGEGPPPIIRRVPGIAYSTLIVKSVDVTFEGIVFDSNQPSAVHHNKVGARGLSAEGARLVAKQCIFRNLDDCFFCTAATYGLLVQWCTITPDVRAYGVWLDGKDIVVLGSTFQDSQEEHPIRTSQVGFHNLLLYQSDFTNTHGKETVTIRVGENVYISHCAFHNWVKFGPGRRKDRPETPLELRTKHANHIVFTNNRVDNRAWITMDEGIDDLTIRYNKIDQDTDRVPLQVQGPDLRNIRVEDNIRNLTAGPTPKPFIHESEVQPGTITETGTKTVDAEKK